jgi:hypothetical protein
VATLLPINSGIFTPSSVIVRSFLIEQHEHFSTSSRRWYSSALNEKKGISPIRRLRQNAGYEAIDKKTFESWVLTGMGCLESFALPSSPCVSLPVTRSHATEKSGCSTHDEPVCLFPCTALHAMSSVPALLFLFIPVSYEKKVMRIENTPV